MVPLIYTEQNFIVEFFHASSSESGNFVDAINQAHPQDRGRTDLFVRKPNESDTSMARYVGGTMTDIFSFWAREMQNLIEWAITGKDL